MARLVEHVDLLDELAAGIRALTSSEAWVRYLAVQERFHRYTPQNALLIPRQRPDATLVAGVRQWNRLGRRVRAAERGIRILAPLVRRAQDAGDRCVVGFRWVSVFDVSQTEGKLLPSVTRLLEGDDAGWFPRLVAVASRLGFRVVDHDFAGATNGDTSHAARLIRLASERSPRQRTKTLAHELAHVLLHAAVSSRALAELEAESVSWIVCRHLGIDANEYSFGYVASWAGDSAAAEAGIRASCERIQRAALTILEFLEDGAQGAPLWPQSARENWAMASARSTMPASATKPTSASAGRR